MAGIIACYTFPNCKVGYFRRRYTQLEGPGGAIQRSHELLSSRAKWNGKNRRWTFPGNATLQFCHIDRDEDCMNFQSLQFDIILFDEATQFNESMIRYMLTRLRATTDGSMGTFIGLATNPGNVGHAAFKEQYVLLGPPEIPHVYTLDNGGTETHIFIPSKLSDNMILEERDPDYRKNLENQPEIIRRQLLEGDWDIAEGVAFTEWNKNIHICEPFAIPDEWPKFRSLDWGFSKPFSVCWFTIDFDGRIFMYRELYGWNGKPDEGCKLDPEDVAKRIMELEKGENIRYAVADDAIFGGMQSSSASIAEQFAMAFDRQTRNWEPVGKGPKSRISGKLEVHHRLKWNKDANGKWDGVLPMVVVFNNCKHLIRTLPSLTLDNHNLEDVDTSLEDHIYDSFRYGMMSRPMIPKKKEDPKSSILKDKEQKAKKRNHLRVI